MRAYQLVGVGAVSTVCCTTACLLTSDPRWIGAAIGVGLGALALLRASWAIDRLLTDPVSPGPGLPVPPDPTPGDFSELEGHFAALDAELRLSSSLLARRTIAAARRRERVNAGPAEKRAWQNLRGQLEELS